MLNQMSAKQNKYSNDMWGTCYQDKADNKTKKQHIQWKVFFIFNFNLTNLAPSDKATEICSLSLYLRKIILLHNLFYLRIPINVIGATAFYSTRPLPWYSFKINICLTFQWMPWLANPEVKNDGGWKKNVTFRLDVSQCDKQFALGRLVHVERRAGWNSLKQAASWLRWAWWEVL